MSTVFQTIPTMNPQESAFVLTVDDNLVLPSTVPAVYTRFADWELGQKDRTFDTEWQDYVFVDTENAAPGRRSFIFAKDKTEAEADVPFETYFDNEFYRWPTVLVQRLRIYRNTVASGNTGSYNGINYIKSAAEVNSLIKVEHFQSPRPYAQKKLRHIVPITDDLVLPEQTINDCLHGRLELFKQPTDTGGVGIGVAVDEVNTGVGYTVPATNFTDWTPLVLS